jgi:hypothetical protein
MENETIEKMTLSEEQKELIRSLFKTGTHIVRWDSIIVGNTCYVNSLEELERAFNDDDLRMIVCYELSPYSNIQELLSASKEHGPYVKKSGERYYLITSIYKVSDDDCRVALEGNHKGNLNFKELLNTCRWQDGTYCGKRGNEVFRWSCFSGVITMNI